MRYLAHKQMLHQQDQHQNSMPLPPLLLGGHKQSSNGNRFKDFSKSWHLHEHHLLSSFSDEALFIMVLSYFFDPEVQR